MDENKEISKGFQNKSNKELQEKKEEIKRKIKILEEDKDNEGVAQQKKKLKEIRKLLENRKNEESAELNQLEQKQITKSNIKKYDDSKDIKNASQEKKFLKRFCILADIEEAKRNITKFEEEGRAKKALEEINRKKQLEEQLENLNSIEKYTEKMDQISKEPNCKKFFEMASDFFKNISDLKITSFVSFCRKNDLNPKIKEDFINLLNLFKAIVEKISLQLNELDLFKMEKFYDDFENKEAILYLEQILKFLNFSERIQNLEKDISIYPDTSIEKKIMKLIYEIKLSLLSDQSIILQKFEEIKKQLVFESLKIMI